MFYKIRPQILCGLFEHESQGDPNAVGDGGMARGLGQMHDVACRTVGFDWQKMFDPAEAIPASAAYLAFCIRKFNGSEEIGLMAYNQGPTVIGKAFAYAGIVQGNAALWAKSTTQTQS